MHASMRFDTSTVQLTATLNLTNIHESARASCQYLHDAAVCFRGGLGKMDTPHPPTSPSPVESMVFDASINI